jgi:uncharacterized NAD(P)/FAD-binding protein YdhS
MKTITIIGGGASGTLLTINLLRNASGQPLTINLIERRKQIGRGVAFGTARDAHLLNVPAAKMGAFPEDVEHFHKWLRQNNHEYEATSFVPRRIYGEYLQEALTHELANLPENLCLRMVDEEAVDIKQKDGKQLVKLRSGETISSERVVLAFGNFRPPHPSVPDKSFVSSKKYFQDPWSPEMYQQIDPQESIFIVGTGLSMADIVLHLFRQGHQGEISAISTRGLLPAVHKLGFSYPSFYDELKPLTRISDVLKVVRRHISAAHADSSDWRAVIDSLRPYTQELWLTLPLAEKRYFMQHLSRYWNVARHRMPAEAAAVLNSMQLNGKLEILKGRLQSISADPASGFRITYSQGDDTNTTISDVLINCIGSESNYERVESTLVQNLIRSGQIRKDSLSMGLDATPDGAIIDQEEKVSVTMYTLGTALKGILWESTAIPEIRMQARQLSLRLLNE